MIAELSTEHKKKAIARIILESLPEWFGLTESRERYIEQSATQTMFAAFQDQEPAGFLCLAPTGNATVEIVVMGVKKENQHAGIGRKLVEQAKTWTKDHGYSFLQVKTVAQGFFEEYDATNRFYRSAGFKEFELIPDLWDKNNPCQIYIMHI